MKYIWDNNDIINTFRLCTNTLNNARGYNLKFRYYEAGDKYITAFFIDLNENFDFELNFKWEYLVEAASISVEDKADFNKINDEQYLNLCKYIVKYIWSLARVF